MYYEISTGILRKYKHLQLLIRQWIKLKKKKNEFPTNTISQDYLYDLDIKKEHRMIPVILASRNYLWYRTDIQLTDLIICGKHFIGREIIVHLPWQLNTMNIENPVFIREPISLYHLLKKLTNSTALRFMNYTENIYCLRDFRVRSYLQ